MAKRPTDIKYFVVQESSYEDTWEEVWEVRNEDSKLYLALEKAGEFGAITDIVDKKPKEPEDSRSFDEYLDKKVEQIGKYLESKKNYRSWKNIIETKGRFDGASLGKWPLEEGELKERFVATHGIQFIEETQRVIDKLNKAGTLATILTRQTNAS